MKVGDKVAITGRLGTIGVATIDRETKLYWIVKGDKYNKENLTTPGNSYFRNRIEPATQQHLDELKKRRLARKLSETEWSKLDLETLEKVFAIVCGMAETKEKGK